MIERFIVDVDPEIQPWQIEICRALEEGRTRLVMHPRGLGWMLVTPESIAPASPLSEKT